MAQTTVSAKQFGSSWAKTVSVKPQLVVIFTRQLASMLENAVPILSAMNTLSHQAADPSFGEVIRLCCERIETGGDFSRAIANFPKVFPPIYKTMVQIGEQTGALDSALNRLALWLERDEALRQRLKSALVYPAFVSATAFCMTLGIFYTIMPIFVGIFADMKIQLPAITKLMVLITSVLRSPPQLLLMLAVVTGSITYFRRWTSTLQGYATFFQLCLKVPVLGDMLSFGGLARFCSAMEALLQTGMDITTSLRMAASASGSPLLQKNSPALVASVVEGNPIVEHMNKFPEVYPTTLRNMIGSGEEVSRLPEMFSRTATFYELEMNYKVEALGATLEPVLLAGVSMIVATIVLSIFLPLYSYIGQLGM